MSNETGVLCYILVLILVCGAEGQLRRRKNRVFLKMLFCGREARKRGEAPSLLFLPTIPVPRRTASLSLGGADHILVGVLAEDVLDNHDGFLDHIVDLGLDEIEQRAHTALCRLLWEGEIVGKASVPFSSRTSDDCALAKGSDTPCPPSLSRQEKRTLSRDNWWENEYKMMALGWQGQKEIELD